MTIEIDPADVVVAAAVGEPGQRTFYLQARNASSSVTLLCEKQQVAVLAVHVDELLDRVGGLELAGAGAPEPDTLALEPPLDPDFRVGDMAIGYDEERDLVSLRCQEFVPEDEEPVGEPGSVRILASRGQMWALARRAESEVESGRPICRMCGESMDADGHFCPRSNGHRAIGGVGP